MSELPSLSYRRIISALQRDGWVVVRQKGSHIRLHKRTPESVMKLTVPAHKPVKRSTLRRILSQAEMDLDEFLKLLR
jgi:predicted RNA binding protein YcfA (HicA-like mRNA interferase family)